MNSFITGGAGFIGSHLAERLVHQGDTVFAIDDLSTGRIENLKFTQGSIFEQGIMRYLISQCDEVYHLAASVGVRLVVDQPVRSIETNIQGTDLLLKLADEKGGSLPMPRILIASTSEVYGKGHGRPLREEDDMLLGPTTRTRWCYACSKAVDEFLALAYHQQIGLPVCIARLFNTVGPRQVGAYGMVLPRFVQQALRGEPLTVYDDGAMVRCFCHVADVVGALIALNRHPDTPGQVFNVGSEEPVTILELAERVKRLAGSDAPITFVPYEEAYRRGFEDIRHRVPDLSKVAAAIGYRPERTLDQIIGSVIAYYRKEMNGND